MNRADIIEALESNKGDLATKVAEADDVLEARRRLFLAGRSLVPPVPYDALGAAAGVSDAAVRKSMARSTSPKEATNAPTDTT